MNWEKEEKKAAFAIFIKLQEFVNQRQPVRDSTHKTLTSVNLQILGSSAGVHG